MGTGESGGIEWCDGSEPAGLLRGHMELVGKKSRKNGWCLPIKYCWENEQMKKQYIYVILLMIGLAFFWHCSGTITDNDEDSPINPGIGASPWYTTPHWSPDNEWIAFSWHKDVLIDSICLVRPDGSDRKSIAVGSLPCFSPSGNEIALVIGVQIFVFNIAKQSYRQLTFEEENFYPRWSPDGKRIVYDSNLILPKKGNVIWLMDPDGSNKKDISIHEVGEWRFPRWTPDYKIVYSWALGDWNLFLMDSTGQNHKRLTDKWVNIFPDVSPDGSSIVWEVVIRELNEHSIWIMDIDGNNKRKLTIGMNPCFSPSGREIAFVDPPFYPVPDGCDNNDPKYRGRLCIYELDTGNEYQILP
jgi:Tol biopolymer transport system component